MAKKNKEQIILIGGGGHCKACIDVIEQAGNYQIAGIVDLPEKINTRVLGYEIVASDNDLELLANDYAYFLITVGQIESPDKRIHLFQKLQALNACLPEIISPLAYVSRHAVIQPGTIIMHYGVVNAGAKIGPNCIINTKALIEHDAVIGANCHISTGAIINGRTIVGPGTFVGSNAVCRDNIQVPPNTVIGFGTNVNRKC